MRSRRLAIVVVMAAAIAIVAGLVFVVIAQIRSGFPDLQIRSLSAYEEFKTFLATSPLRRTNAQVNTYVTEAIAAVQKEALLT